MMRQIGTFFFLLALAFAESFVGFSTLFEVPTPFLWIAIPFTLGIFSSNSLALGPTLSMQLIVSLAITRLPHIEPRQVLFVLCLAAVVFQLSLGLYKAFPKLLSRAFIVAYSAGLGFWMIIFYFSLLLGLKPQLSAFIYLLEDVIKQVPRFTMEHSFVISIPDNIAFLLPHIAPATVAELFPYVILLWAAIVFDYLLVREIAGFEEGYPVIPTALANVLAAFFGMIPFSISPLRAPILVERPIESRSMLLLVPVAGVAILAASQWKVQIPIQLVAVFGIIAAWKILEPGRLFAEISRQKTKRFIPMLLMFQTMAWNLGLMIVLVFVAEIGTRVFRRAKDQPLMTKTM